MGLFSKLFRKPKKGIKILGTDPASKPESGLPDDTCLCLHRRYLHNGPCTVPVCRCKEFRKT